MEVYTTREASKLLGVDATQIRKWISDGILDATINNNREGYLITKESVDRLLLTHHKKTSFKDFILNLENHRQNTLDAYKKHIESNPKYKFIVDQMNKQVEGAKGLSLEWNTCYWNFLNRKVDDTFDAVTRALLMCNGHNKKRSRKKCNRHNGGIKGSLFQRR